MIKEITMYTIICDGCGKDSNAESEFSGWNDKDYVIECSEEDNWFSEDGVKFYCPDCYDFDEDGEPELRVSEPDKNLIVEIPAKSTQE